MVLSACVLSPHPPIPTIPQASMCWNCVLTVKEMGTNGFYSQQTNCLMVMDVASSHGYLGAFWAYLGFLGYIVKEQIPCLHNHLFQESELMFEIQYGVAMRSRNASKALKS